MTDSAPSRVLFVDAGLRSEQGHYLAWIEAVQAVFKRNGSRCVVLGGRGAPPGVRPALQTPGGAFSEAWRAARPAAFALAQRGLSASTDAGPRRLLRGPMRLVAEADRQLRRLQDPEGSESRALSLGKSQAEDVKRALRADPLGPGDLVVFPSAGEVETAAVLHLLATDEGARRASWRLMYRHPPQEGGGLLCRLAHRAVRTGADVVLLSDTQQLVRAFHDRAGLASRLAPIPHTRAQAPAKRTDGSPKVVYLGDARTEKGFALLPAVVAAVRARPELASARFVFQTIFNVPGGEIPCARALADLRRLADPNVELIDRVLDRRAYEAMIGAADLVLGLYDPKAYRERSSGVVSEAVAAGVPVVVTAGTSTAEELREFDLEDSIATSWEEAPDRVVAALVDLPRRRELATDAAVRFRRRHSAEATAEALTARA